MGRLAAVTALAGVVSTAACATPDSTIDTVFDPCEPLVIAVDGWASDAERDSVVAAIAPWNELAGARLTTEQNAGVPQIPLRFEPAALFVYGVYDDEVGEIVINRSLGGFEARTITIAHEIGHAFGLEHVDAATRSLMNKGNLEDGLTGGDVIRLEALWGRCAPLEPTETTRRARARARLANVDW